MSENTTYNQLTLFAEDSLASLTVWPGSDEARKMTVTSGQNIAALLPNLDPLTSLARMCLESNQLFSTRCYLTWKTLTTPGNRLLFQLAPSMPPTEETECSLWPTPTASTGGPEPEGKTGRKLATIVKLFPTPKATDGSKGSRTAAGALKELERGKNKDFGMVAALWPTPRARDWKGQTQRGQYAPGDGLCNALNVTGGSLNPEWVEWLMGFPIGWTDLEASETP